MSQRTLSVQDRGLPFNANILDGLPDPVILLDRERRVVGCNTPTIGFVKYAYKIQKILTAI